MARYKHYDYNKAKMIPLCFTDQIQTSSYKYTQNHVVDNDIVVLESGDLRDSDSAKMTKWLKAISRIPHKANLLDETSNISKGITQGYNDDVAAVDNKHQIIDHAHDYGTSQEQHILELMLIGIHRQLRKIQPDALTLCEAKITASSGFHSDANVKLIYRPGINGYTVDNQFHKDYPRFAESVIFKTTKAQRRKERGGQMVQRFTH